MVGVFFFCMYVFWDVFGWFGVFLSVRRGCVGVCCAVVCIYVVCAVVVFRCCLLWVCDYVCACV